MARALLLSLFVLLLACEAEGTFQAPPDTLADVGRPDAGFLPAPDAVPDAVPDMAPDMAPDTAPDAVPDAVPDTAPDTAPDTVPDTDLASPDWAALSPRTSLAEGFHVPLTVPAPGERFSLVVASDPQMWWNFINGQGGVDDATVEARNQLHIDAMNALIDGEGLPDEAPPPVAVVMNGDLTEYGRWSQWDAYYRLYEGVRAPIFDGLGNHDYQNNNRYVSDGCGMDIRDYEAWQAACAAGAERTVWGQSACEVAGNFTELWGWCASDAMRRTRYWLATHAADLHAWDEASGAYSWEWGDYHFVQLQNFPEYEVPETQVCSSVAWLQHDLHEAWQRGKRLVLHMHQPVRASLRPALAGFEYAIAGIFFGHIHNRAGFGGSLRVGAVDIPTFYSGSVEWNLFLLADFAPDALRVTVIDSRTGAPAHHATVAEYQAPAGASISAPRTYTLPDNPCPLGENPSGEDGACEAPVFALPEIQPCY